MTLSLIHILQVQRFENALFVRGNISAPFKFRCVRCLGYFEDVYKRQVLGRYDSTGTGILSEQDKARLVEDARAAQREARKKFLMQFDKDGDLSLIHI